MDVFPTWTIPAALATATECFAHLDALACADAGPSRTVTWRELHDRVNQVTLRLEAIGLRPGTAVPVLAAPSVEQTAAELAVLHAGAVTAPMSAGAPGCAVAALARRWPVDLAVVDSPEAAARIRGALGVVTILVLRGSTPGGDRMTTWGAALARGRRRLSPLQQRAEGGLAVSTGPPDPTAVMAIAAPDDPPVVVSPGALAGAARQIARCVDTRPGDRLVVCVDAQSTHERWTLEWHALMTGATRYLFPACQDVADALRRARPTVFAADSRRWEVLAVVVRRSLVDRNGDLDEALSFGLEVARLPPSEKAAAAVARYASVASTLAGVRSLVGLDECRVALACEPLPSDVDALFCSIGLPIQIWIDTCRHVSQLTSVRGSGL